MNYLAPNKQSSKRSPRRARQVRLRRAVEQLTCGSQLEALEPRRLLTCNVISGYVYYDVNNNGLLDVGESPIANSSIELHNSSNQVIASGLTDANGYYQFDQDGTVPVSADLDYQIVFADQLTNWSDSKSVSQFDPSLGTLTSVEISEDGSITSRIEVENTSGSSGSTINANVGGTLTLTGPSVAGLVVTPASQLETFSATTYDGFTDFGGTSGKDYGFRTTTASDSTTLSAAGDIAPYIGVGTVSFTESATATSAVTASGGNVRRGISTSGSSTVKVIYHYVPDNCLQPGDYTIVQTVQPAGYLDGQETAGNVAPIPNTVGTDFIQVTLADTDLPNNNFGELKPATIGNFIFDDLNANGIQDLGEGGVAGATVQLFDSSNTQVGASQTTVADGLYLFTGVAPGDYYVKVTPPGGYLFSPQDQGGDDQKDSDANTTTGQMPLTTLSPEEDDRSWDAGLYQLASIGDFVFTDNNANGIQDAGDLGLVGATVQLFNSSNVPVAASQVTGASGSYLFTGLTPGDYYVKVTPPAGYLFSPQDQGSDDTKDSDANTSTGRMATTTLTSGEDDRTWDAGLYKLGQLSGYVYDDCSTTVSTSNNGLKDAGESGIGNGSTYAKVELLNSGGTVIATTYTNSTGSYTFTNLAPGTYSIRETTPPGYLDGKDKVGTQGGTQGNDLFSNIVVVSGTNGTNNNFGELDPASLSGYVYDDLNNDGVFNSPIEEGIPGVTVTLTGNNDLGASVTLTTVSDANGLYTFTNLRPGTYQLKETQPLTFVDGKDTIGTPGGTTTNDTFSNIVLNCGVKGANNNYGELGLLHGLTGTIGFWANKNGQQMINLLNATSTSNTGKSTALGNWLASSFPKIYGASSSPNYFKGKTTSAIAARFIQLKDVTGQKLDAQLLGLCLAIYTTTKELNSTSMGQSFATQHSFILSSQSSSANLKNTLWNVGVNGEAFATKSGSVYVTADNQSLSVWTLLQRTNGFAANGVLWASPLTVNSVLYSSLTLQNQGNVVFSAINQAGDIIS